MIVMPAYNAAKTLKVAYKSIPKNAADEIVLVDDYSSDNTIQVAKHLPLTVITHSRNRGYGGNQKTCYNYALENKADIVVMLHPDNQYDPSIINELILPIKEGNADVVFASRFIRNPIEGGPLKGGMPLYKYIANKLLTAIENFWLGTYFSEFHTGYRAYSGKILSKIPYWANSDDFVFDNEIIVQLVMIKAKFHEIAVKTKYFKEASSINFIRSSQYGIGILILLLKYSLYKMKLLNFPQFDFTVEKHRKNLKKNSVAITHCPNCKSKKRHIEIHGFPKWEGDIYQCEQCGLYYYDQHPKSIKKHYKNFYRKNSSQYNMILELIIKNFRYKRMKFINRYYPLKKKGSILDIETDRGDFLNFFKKRGWKVFGTQMNHNTINSIKRKFNITVDFGELPNLKYKKNSFSVITAFHVLEHIKNPFQYMKKIYNLLEPNGIFVVEVPQFEHALKFSYGSRWAALDIPNHLYHFDRIFLKKFLEDIGFTIEFETEFSFEFSIFNVVQSWLNLWHKKYNVFIRELLPIKLHKILFSKLFYKELFLIIIGAPVILYQILKLKLYKNNGDTLRLVVKKK